MKIRAIVCSFILLLTTATLAFATSFQDDTHHIDAKNVEHFSSALGHIKSFYVKPIDDEKLFEDAIRGMLAGLDPHSAYLDKEAFKNMTMVTQGEYGGLGIEITMEKDVIKIVSPIDDTPAAKAGLEAGDLIVKIDNHPVSRMDISEAVKKMRGKAGTKIKLTIYRKDAPTKAKQLFTVELTRAIIQIHTVKAYLIDGDIAYVRVSHFQAPTAAAMREAITKLKKQAKGKLHGLVLDLRNNPGGLLDAAIDISDTFIHNDQKGKEELIVLTKGRVEGASLSAKATPGDIIKGVPMVVLINQGSASASEIVAGALQDNARAMIMGQKSFGKGSVQTVFPLEGGRGIKLTTAEYYTPSGRSIQAKGIEPDIVVENVAFKAVKEDLSDIGYTSEADLPGHLINSQKTAKKQPASKQNTSDVTSPSLLKKDYPLYQAIVLLKGIHVLQAQKQR